MPISAVLGPSVLGKARATHDDRARGRQRSGLPRADLKVPRNDGCDRTPWLQGLNPQHVDGTEMLLVRKLGKGGMVGPLGGHGAALEVCPVAGDVIEIRCCRCEDGLVGHGPRGTGNYPARDEGVTPGSSGRESS